MKTDNPCYRSIINHKLDYLISNIDSVESYIFLKLFYKFSSIQFQFIYKAQLKTTTTDQYAVQNEITINIIEIKAKSQIKPQTIKRISFKLRIISHLDLKLDSLGEVLILIGRLFQHLGAAMANARSPLDFSLVLATTKSLKLADLRALAGWCLSTGQRGIMVLNNLKT